MNNIATETREKLKEIVSRSGEEILHDTDRCEGLLKDHCGLHRKEIAALVGALEERVPLELKSSWQGAMSPEAMRSRLVQRMQDNRGLAPDLADWAVDAWSYALGVGLGRRSAPIVEPKPIEAPVVNPIVAGLVAERPVSHPQPQPQRQSQPQPAQAAQVTAETTSAAAPWSAQKKAVAGVAAAVALYFAYTNGVVPHTPTVAKDCPAGQTQAADGNCVAVAKDQPKQQDPTTKPATVLTAGTSIPVTVNEPLNSDTVAIGQYVKGTVNAPIVINGKTLIPAGTKVVLQVKGVDQSGKVLGAAKIDLALVEMNVGGKKYNIASARGAVTGPSKTAQTVKDAGILGVVGTGIGCGIGILTKHPGAGCAAGAGGGVATGVVISAKDKPKPAVLEAGNVVRFKLGQPVNFA